MAVLKGGTRVDGDFNVLGNINAGGTISGATKNFDIEHPLNKSKRLIHGCVEGPEYGVYYRGEGQLKDGTTTIILPDYFEALTRKDGRTIQITVFSDKKYIEDDQFEVLITSRIENGSFNVYSRSKYSNRKFYWEVKAIRSDIDKLKVEIKATN